MKTKALLIGINDYKPAGPGGSDLRGCVNDVKDMANTLVICGYRPEMVRILTDSRATKINIMNGIKWLLQGAKAGDALVLYYSGHGSYVTDMDGDELDGKDEVICPHDWPQYISDDDLRKAFAGLPPQVNLEVIMDCCHSGTGTRAALELTPGAQEQLLTPRFMPAPYDYAFYEEFKADYKRAPAQFASLAPRKSTRDIVTVPAMNHVLWAACKDVQLANETAIGSQVRGIFTNHLCAILRATSGNIERRKLDMLVNVAIARYRYNQNPRVESTAAAVKKTIFS